MNRRAALQSAALFLLLLSCAAASVMEYALLPGAALTAALIFFSGWLVWRSNR